MPNWLKRLIPTVLSTWLALLIEAVFVTINPFDSSSRLVVMISLSAILLWGLSLTRLPTIIKWLLILSHTLFWLWRLLTDNQRGWFSWLTRYFRQLSRNFIEIQRRGTVDMPQTLAVTLGVILLLGLLLLIIFYQRPIIAVVLALAYLMAVHIFNGDELLATFFQVCLILFLLLTWQQVGQRPSWKIIAPNLVPFVIIGGLFALIKSQSTINNQLLFQTVSLRNRLNATGFYDAIDAYVNQSRKTGFTENDQSLGGPIHDDPTAVMTVTQKTPHYFRVGIKQHYTGRGWETPGINVSKTNDRNYLTKLTELPVTIRDNAADPTIYRQTPEKIKIQNHGQQPFIGLPYGQLRLTQVSPGPAEGFYNHHYDRLYPGSDATFQMIDLNVADKAVTAAQLATVSFASHHPEPVNLQLPQKMPARIKTLAEKITANATTVYDKVSAINNYLSTNDQFTYSKVDTPKTPKNRDYVDYFLFDSKVGYCDNFSSAMVILLRSLNIEARWAKGFNDGTLNKKLANGRGEYVITNADAHSWPEVYFPTYGWLPFEPTPGFYNEDQPQLDTNRTTTAANTSASSQASSSVTSSSARTSSRRSSQTTESKTTTKSATAIPRWLQMTLNLIGVLALLSSLPWLGLFVFQSASHRLTPAKYPRFYRQLLWLLQVVVRRPPAQPLIDYAADVDARLGLTNVFTALTVAYEAQEFGGRLMMPDVGKIDLLLGRLRVWVLRRGHI